MKNGSEALLPSDEMEGPVMENRLLGTYWSTMTDNEVLDFFRGQAPARIISRHQNGLRTQVYVEMDWSDAMVVIPTIKIRLRHLAQAQKNKNAEHTQLIVSLVNHPYGAQPPVCKGNFLPGRWIVANSDLARPACLAWI